MDELPDALDIPQVTWAGVATGAVALLLAALLAWLVRTVVRRLLVWRGRSENSADVFARLLGLVILAFGFGAALTIALASVIDAQNTLDLKLRLPRAFVECRARHCLRALRWPLPATRGTAAAR